MQAVKQLLDNGNDVLIVSKPHLECIQRLCTLPSEHILFRFTIGAYDDDTLRFWEPGAPPYDERLASLKYAFDAGFKTSVNAPNRC